MFKNYLENCENRYCSCIHKQCKTLFRDHMVLLKTISLYTYKVLRLTSYDLRSSESRDHYHEDGNLVPSHRCSSSLEAAVQI